MTIHSADRDDVTSAPSPAPGGVPRRRLMILAAGAAVGGAAAAMARPTAAWAVGSSLLAPTAVSDDAVSSRPDVVADWLEQVVATAPPSAMAPAVADRVWAISWVSALAGLAVLRAGPERGLSARQRSGFEDSAVATAVHDALVALIPDQTARLDAALRDSLAAVPDGDAKEAGIQAGRGGAARTLRKREGDGLDLASINRPFTPPPETPGVYRLPPGATATLGAGLGRARPFLLGRADRFRPGPPPALGTAEYRRGLRELRRLGGAVSDRTDLQSTIAWLAPGMQYVPALRALVRGPGHSLPWKVRLLAAYATATLDAQIAVSDGKFTYLHWRPVTAIRTAGTDGDPRTNPDPGWSSYLTTPPNPEWPSGHGAGAGAAERVLGHFVGPRTPISFAATITRGDGRVVSREYRRGTRWSTLTQENVDARVWAGVHFRFSDEAGATLGRRVAAYNLQRFDRILADQ